nr:MAG TPA: hypothetical protein [Caudoviricetes sp.]
MMKMQQLKIMVFHFGIIHMYTLVYIECHKYLKHL